MAGLNAGQVLALILPLIVLELGLFLFAVHDLLLPERKVRGGNKGVWALVILFVSLIGPLLYLMIGREDV